MGWSNQYKIDVIRDVVPKKVKPWILLLFFLIFQFSGGVYMAAVTQMSGALSLMHEDIMMAGYASLVGLCLTFTIMYRLKFCFTVKTGLIVSAVGLLCCNIICLNTANVPVLVAVSFVAGIFRMWGTFMCNTTIAPWIFPQWTMAKFQCYIQPAVMGFMLLSGLVTVYIACFFQWQYVYWFIMGLLLCMLAFVLVFFLHRRPMRKLPLYGIDWMGGVLWGITALCVIFVLNYGDYYDWFHSKYIWTGIVLGLIALVLNLWRASFIRHPYVSNQIWKFRNVRISFFLLFVVYLLVSPSACFEPMYMSAVLKFDSLNQISLNWISLAGYLCGGGFAYMTLALRNWRFKSLTLIAFLLVMSYLLIMYFVIDYNLSKEALYLPVFLRSAGIIIIPITFLTSIFKTIPFQNFFQALNMVTIVTACCGPLLGSAILTHLFKVSMKSDMLLFSANWDSVERVTGQLPADVLSSHLQQQAMLVSMKEIYGLLCIVSVFCMLLFLLRESSLRPHMLYAKLSTLRHVYK
jgi:hypothetical protein